MVPHHQDVPSRGPKQSASQAQLQQLSATARGQPGTKPCAVSPEQDFTRVHRVLSTSLQLALVP